MPIGPYFADFACKSARLVIEVDGPSHDGDQLRHDARRTTYLLSQGYQVVRCTATDVMDEIDGVLDDIHLALLARLPPRPVSSLPLLAASMTCQGLRGA